MQDVWTALREWRRAEERLDDLPVDSPEWQPAAEEVIRTRAAYQATTLRATANVHAAEVAAQPAWAAPASGAGMGTSD
jgi:hypothetical protein